MSRLRSLGTLAREEKGASLVELAAAFPVLLLLLLGTIDVSRMVAARLHVEQAAQRTAEYALAVRPRGNEGNYLKAEGIHASGEPGRNVDVEIFLECGGVKQKDFKAECAPGSPPARFVAVAIRTQYEPFFAWSGLASLFGEAILPETVELEGDSIVRFQ